MDNYNYPMGADNKDAPWNVEELPVKEFETTVITTLTKQLVLSSNDYTKEVEEDEDSNIKYDRICTEDISWIDCFKKENHYTVLELLEILKKEMIVKLRSENQNKKYIQHIIDECTNWIEDDFDIVEN